MRLFIFYLYVNRSLLILVALILIYSNVKVQIFFILKHNSFFYQTAFYMVVFFYRIAVKIPMVPFHVWYQKRIRKHLLQVLCISCSVVKVGSYGMLKFLFPLFYDITLFIHHCCYYYLFQVCFMFINCYKTSDIKKIIAYSSVAHMSMQQQGYYYVRHQLCRQCFFNVGSWLVSAGLFFCIGFLYERLKHVILNILGVLFHQHLYNFCIFNFDISKYAFPGTSNFVGEFLILCRQYLISQCLNLHIICVYDFIWSIYAF